MKKFNYLVVFFVLILSGCSQGVSIQNAPKPADEIPVNGPIPYPKQDLAPVSAVTTDKTFDLSRMGITKIEMSVFDMTDLEKLDVSYNNLTGALPSQIGKLKNLKVLDASNNKMTGVPAEVGQLEKLEVLDLSNNQLTGLPNEISNLKNLKKLNLSGNQYSEQDLSVIRRSLPDVEYILK